MQVLRRVAGCIETINRKWAAFVSYWVVIIMLVLTMEVVARYIFNSPTKWANQLSILIFGGFFIMGGAYTMMHDGHVRMDLIYNRIRNARARVILDLVTSALFFLFIGALLFKAVPHIWQATLGSERVMGLAWHVIIWPTYWTLPVAAFLLLLEAIIKFARGLGLAIGRSQP